MSKKLGNLVKNARTEKGLSQAALAQQVEGLTAADVGKIERGEKEPSQAVLKLMAKPLGLTQKALLEAASGTGTSGKTAGTATGKTAGKTSGASTGKTSGKTTGKTASSSTAKTSAADLKLTATEKKLVQLYRKADSDTKKAAMNLLAGESNPLEMIGAILSGKGQSGSSSSSSSSGASDLLSSLLSGKTGSSSSGKDKDTLSALLQALGKK